MGEYIGEKEEKIHVIYNCRSYLKKLWFEFNELIHVKCFVVACNKKLYKS